MTHLYNAEGSFVLLRPKNKVKVSTLNTKCRQVDLYGEMDCTNRGDFISQASERPKTFRFFQEVRLIPMRSLKKVSMNGRGGGDDIK